MNLNAASDAIHCTRDAASDLERTAEIEPLDRRGGMGAKHDVCAQLTREVEVSRLPRFSWRPTRLLPV